MQSGRTLRFRRAWKRERRQERTLEGVACKPWFGEVVATTSRYDDASASVLGFPAVSLCLHCYILHHHQVSWMVPLPHIGRLPACLGAKTFHLLLRIVKARLAMRTRGIVGRIAFQKGGEEPMTWVNKAA